MSEIIGPFHSLSESDRRGLVALVGSGRSVRSAAGELGCHYGHALNFCHAFGLPVVFKAKRVDRRGSQAFQLVELVRSGLSVHQAAKRCGMHLTAAYAVATEAGCHIRLSESVRLFVCGGLFHLSVWMDYRSLNSTTSTSSSSPNPG